MDLPETSRREAMVDALRVEIDPIPFVSTTVTGMSSTLASVSWQWGARSVAAGAV